MECVFANNMKHFQAAKTKRTRQVRLSEYEDADWNADIENGVKVCSRLCNCPLKQYWLARMGLMESIEIPYPTPLRCEARLSILCGE